MDKSLWNEIQKYEFQYHLGKDRDHLLDVNLRYWNSFLGKLTPYISYTNDTRILDIGCGCCGVLMAMEKGQRVGVDPLMDQYLEHFEHLHHGDIKWVTGSGEGFEANEPFDIIFTINALDHTYDPPAVGKTIDRVLRPGGHLIIGLNCHNTDFFYAYYNRYSTRLDRHHPHHFRPADVLGLFPDYRILDVEDIDDMYLNLRTEYREKVLKQRGIDWYDYVSYLRNPLKYILILARTMGGRHLYRNKPGQKSVFSTYIFILEKSL